MQKRLLTTSLLITYALPEAVQEIGVRAGHEKVEIVFVIISGDQSNTKLMIDLAVGKKGDQRFAFDDFLAAKVINLLAKLLSSLDLFVILNF